jgi:uncharacterized coiled-coil protein SlyX
MALYTKRIVHDVSKDGTLFFLLNGFNGALNKLAEQIGGGLQAIAVALATPQDNSTEVQKHLNELNLKLKASNETLQAAINKFKGE